MSTLAENALQIAQKQRMKTGKMSKIKNV